MSKISRIDVIGQNGNDGDHYDDHHDPKPKCSHVFVSYYSMNYRQCIDCNQVLPINKNQNITGYKRNSTI